MTSPRMDARRRKDERDEKLAARGVRCARAAFGLWIVLGLVLAPGSAAAALPGARWVSVSVLAGSAQPIAAMADYQWDVRPHAAWGAQLLAGAGPVAAGVRWWRGSTTQAVGLAGSEDPTVRTASVELLARARVTKWRSVQLWGIASGGRLAITYQPDHLTIDTGGAPIQVALAPVHEWVAGAGLALQAPLANRWAVALETERRMYAIDTAHRSGNSVTFARETFGDWDARVAVSRAWDW